MTELSIQLADTTLSPDERFAILENAVLKSKAESTARVYATKYRKWRKWCSERGIDPLSLTYANVTRFIESGDTTTETRKQELAAMRNLLRRLAIYFPDDHHIAVALAELKDHRIRRSREGVERQHRALNTEEVRKVLSAWADDNRLINIRNTAMLQTFFGVGLRADECLELKWKDIDFSRRLVTIWHGKGDKERIVPILSKGAVTALQLWRNEFEDDYNNWVWVKMSTNGKRIAAFTRITYDQLTNVFSQTTERCGVELTSHDARHTVITDIISCTRDDRAAQFQAGHADISTTLNYRDIADAQDVLSKITLSWED